MSAAVMMRMYLVRHPQPLVGPGICYGRTDLDVAQHAIDALLPSLQASLPDDIALYSSPLQRCAKLARACAGIKKRPVLFDSRLLELDFGRWEIDAWASNPVDCCVGGGGTVRQMAQQVAAFYQERLSQQADCVVICHAGTMRLLLACAGGHAPDDIAWEAAQSRRQIDYGELVILQCR